MLAVIRCLEAWRHYLEGVKLKFKIWTDYKNLQYFMMSQKLNHRQARWALYLSQFNFTLKHVPGGWTNGEDKPGARTVPKSLHQS